MTNLLPYIENGFKIFFNRRHLRKISELRLKNEINYNLRIIDMVQWSNISKETKRHFAKQLTTQALEEYIYLGKPNILDKLLSYEYFKDTEKSKEEESINKESLIGNVINKIKTLKVIIELPEVLAIVDDKSKFTTRLKNITSGLNDLKKLI